MMGMKYHLTSAILHPPMSGASGGYSNLWSSYRQTVVRCYASAESILEQSNTPPEKPGGQGKPFSQPNVIIGEHDPWVEWKTIDMLCRHQVDILKLICGVYLTI